MIIGRNGRILALVGSGHAMSHFYLLALPPLFPLLRANLDASYAGLGLLVTMMNVATGLTQVPAGFLVDRFGARRLLLAGLVLMGTAMALLGLAQSYWLMLLLAIIAGIGNSVFHPADYALLSASVDRGWLGRAFSIHTFTGNLGFMLAPGGMILLTALFGWRGALVAAGLLAFAPLAAMLVWGDLLREEGAAGAGTRGAGPAAPAAGAPLLLSAPILLLFLFYVLIAMFMSGAQSFLVTALHGFHGTDLALANLILSVFLIASAVGVLLGGVLADRTERYALVTVVAFGAAALLALPLGLLPLPPLLMMGMFAVIGVLQGTVRTSRDMMVRMVTPAGATGRVFAFVMTGLNVGAGITPVLFGLLLDFGRPRLVFLLLVAFLIAAAALVLVIQAVIGAHTRGQRDEKLAAE